MFALSRYVYGVDEQRSSKTKRDLQIRGTMDGLRNELVDSTWQTLPSCLRILRGRIQQQSNSFLILDRSIDVDTFFTVGSNRFIRWRDFRVCGSINIRSSLSNHESDVDTRYCKKEYPRPFDNRSCLFVSSFVERCFSWSVSDEWRLFTRLANEW